MSRVVSHSGKSSDSSPGILGAMCRRTCPCRLPWMPPSSSGAAAAPGSADRWRWAQLERRAPPKAKPHLLGAEGSGRVKHKNKNKNKIKNKNNKGTCRVEISLAHPLQHAAVCGGGDHGLFDQSELDSRDH